MISDRHKDNLAQLHAILLQLFADFLERVKADGTLSQEVIDNGLHGFLAERFNLKFTATISPEMMHMICEVEGRQIFNADLAIDSMAADHTRH